MVSKGKNVPVEPVEEKEEFPKRKYIIGGNWKSNGTVEFVRKTCDALNSLVFPRD
jgi:hypothetical protein